jgi:hypothetical protein
MTPIKPEPARGLTSFPALMKPSRWSFDAGLECRAGVAAIRESDMYFSINI